MDTPAGRPSPVRDSWDVVAVVRDGDRNEPLRHMLRSVATNLTGVRRVWMAGHRPAWCDPDTVGHIPGPKRTGSRYRNSTGNLIAALRHNEVAERVLYFNDDMFVTEPTDADDLPVLARGSCQQFLGWLGDRRGGRDYVQGHRDTVGLLTNIGVPHLLSYEAHVPLPIPERWYAAELLVRHAGEVDVLHKRTLLGNLMWAAENTTVMHPKFDAKIATAHTAPRQLRWPGGDRWLDHVPVVSTAPVSWRSTAGEWVRRRWPVPCRFEKS